MLITLPHVVQFRNEKDVTVRDVTDSLLANEQMVLDIGRILELCADGLEVSSIKVAFVSASVNSPLKEALSAGILFTFQDDLKREVPKFIEKLTGAHVDEHYKTLVTVVFLIVVIYGIEQAWKIFKGKEDRARDAHQLPAINGNYNTIVNVGGDLLGIDPPRLKRAVEQTFVKKKRLALARQALSFIKPAKGGDGTAIEGAGLLIEAETVKAAPSEAEVSNYEEAKPPEALSDQTVVIHATDRDHAKSGWAGHVEGIWDKRVPMKFVPGIDPSSVFGKDQIKADILVTYRVNSVGDNVPEALHIFKIHD